jgi:hypothetical protein
VSPSDPILSSEPGATFIGQICQRKVIAVLGGAGKGDNGGVSETASIMNREIRCRCGQLGLISGVEGAEDHPDYVWVTHLVRLEMQTHIHRSPQMPALLAQLSR